MANISTEIQDILHKTRGEDVRDAFVSALRKICGQELPDVSTADKGKILAVDASGKWAALSIVPALDSIAVTTNPTKTTYRDGELLDLTGLVVTATMKADLTGTTTKEVTSESTFVPAEGTAVGIGTTKVLVSYTEDGVTKSTEIPLNVGHSLSSISVSTMPTKTVYTSGEQLDLTGIVVTALYSDGQLSDVTNSCTFSPADGTVLSTTGIQAVSVSYTESGVTRTTSFNVGVDEEPEPPTLFSLSVAHAPTKTVYYVGDTLDLSGAVFTAIYSDSSTKQLTWQSAGIICSPSHGTTLSTSGYINVSVSYTDGGVAKFANFTISVSARLAYLTIASMPTKTNYVVGENFDPSGLSVVFTDTSGTSATVTSSCTISAWADGEVIVIPDGQDHVTYPVGVSYVSGGQTYTASFNVTIHSAS